MKGWSLPLAALALVLSLLLSVSSRVKAEALPSRQVRSLSIRKASSSSLQAPRDLFTHQKNPSKQLDSSFRRIPPSKSNPTQNKFNPPSDG
ncbi:hypothetical protein PIB30_011721 [Stylosanthes scabra]|uniref:Uncharacterized protein n=1 Tax=Stylosanthes scabra TaxID=79078 RepID=A0ABU6Y654_9FABA|nr:hypothetical protein [Stylosanthes scabra]